MNKLRKAAEMIKGSQYPALKDDIYFKQQAKLSQINGYLFTITSGEACDSKEFAQDLSSALEQLFNYFDDEDSSVRLAADTVIIQIIKSLKETQSNRILVELKNIIKISSSPRILRTALARFGDASFLIKPQKRRAFLQSLLPCLAALVSRPEEMVIEGISHFIKKSMPHLGVYLAEKDFEMIMDPLIGQLSSLSPSIRRQCAYSIADMVENSSRTQWHFTHMIERILDFLKQADEEFAANEKPSIIGYLECLKALFKLKVPSATIPQELHYKVVFRLGCVIKYVNSALPSALETLDAFLVQNLSILRDIKDEIEPTLGTEETIANPYRVTTDHLVKIVAGDVLPPLNRSNTRLTATSCLQSLIGFQVIPHGMETLVENLVRQNSLEDLILGIRLSGTCICHLDNSTDAVQKFLGIILMGLKSGETSHIRSSLQALSACIPVLMDKNDVDFKNIFECIFVVSGNSYWLIKCSVLEVIKNCNFTKIFFRTNSCGIQENVLSIFVDYLSSEDVRLRTEASKALVQTVPKFFVPSDTVNNSLVMLSTIRGDVIDPAFPKITEEVSRLPSSFIPTEVNIASARNLNVVLKRIWVEISRTENKDSLEGYIQALEVLASTFTPCSYVSCWMNVGGSRPVLDLLHGHAVAENINCLSQLLSLSGKLLAVESVSGISRSEPVFEAHRNGLLDTAIRILSVFHAVYDDHFASLAPQKASTFPRHFLSPTRKVGSDRGSTERKLLTLNGSGYMWSQSYYVRLYESVRSLWRNSKLSFENTSEEKFLRLLMSTLDVTSIILEISPVSQSTKHYEEILLYLKSCLHFLPAKSTHTANQVLKSLFGYSFFTCIKEGRFSESKPNTLGDDAIEDSLLAQKPYYRPAGKMRIVSLISCSRPPEKLMLATTIVKFEPFVKKVLELYTTTSNTLVQVEILYLVQHLVNIGVSSSLLGPDQVFLKHVIQQLEFLEKWTIPSSDVLLPALFAFLFSVSKAKPDFSPKPILSITRVVQLWRTLIEKQKNMHKALEVGVLVVKEVFETGSRINAEVESCRNVIIEVLKNLELDENVAEMFTSILGQWKQYNSSRYKEVSDLVFHKLLHSSSILSYDILESLVDNCDLLYDFSLSVLKNRQDLSESIAVNFNILVIVIKLIWCCYRHEEDKPDTTRLLDILTFARDVLLKFLYFYVARKGSIEGVRYFLHKVLIEFRNIKDLVLPDSQFIFSAIAKFYGKLGDLALETTFIYFMSDPDVETFPHMSDFYGALYKIQLVIIHCQKLNVTLEDFCKLKRTLFGLYDIEIVAANLKKMMDEYPEMYFEMALEVINKQPSLAKQITRFILNNQKLPHNAAMLRFLRSIIDGANPCLQRYIKTKLKKKLYECDFGKIDTEEIKGFLQSDEILPLNTSRRTIETIEDAVVMLGFTPTPSFVQKEKLERAVEDFQPSLNLLKNLVNSVSSNVIIKWGKRLLELSSPEGDYLLKLLQIVLKVKDEITQMQLIKEYLRVLPRSLEITAKKPSAIRLRYLAVVDQLFVACTKYGLEEELLNHVPVILSCLKHELSSYYHFEESIEDYNLIKEMVKLIDEDPSLKELSPQLSKVCRRLLIFAVRLCCHSKIVLPEEDEDSSESSRLSPTSVQSLQDEDVIRTFNKRIATFGWRSRFDFEEYWMMYLSVLNANMNVQELRNDEAKIIIGVTCEVIEGVTSLLQQSLLWPVPGNPVVSQYLFETPGFHNAFLSTSDGTKMQQMLESISNQVDEGSGFEVVTTDRLNFAGQVSAKFLISSIQVNDPTNLIECSSVFKDSVTFRTYQSMLQDSSLDVRSCIHFLVDLYDQLLKREVSFELHLGLIKSILSLSDFFCEVSKFEWMYSNFINFLRKYQDDEAVCLPYLLAGLAKSSIVLPSEKIHWDEIKKVLVIAIQSPFPKSQFYGLQAVVYMLQCPLESHPSIVGTAGEHLLRYLPNQVSALLSGNLCVVEGILLWFKLGFYLAEYHREKITNYDLVGTVLNQSLTCLVRGNLPPELRLLLLDGILRLAVSGLSHTCYRLIGNYSMKSLKSPSAEVFRTGTSLLMIFYYTGFHYSSCQDEREEINLLSMECIGILFDRFKSGTTLEAAMIASFIGSWLCQVLTLEMALNRAICEFSCIDKNRRIQMAQVVNQVFSYARASGQAEKISNWVTLGAESLFARESLWYMTCILILASTDDLIRNLNIGSLSEDCEDVFHLVFNNFCSQTCKDQAERLKRIADKKLNTIKD
ncbi:huntingtin-like isoform X2 [Artemia franciscana]|uniref:Uncharacterized protein n=1 Tax=Artemia franciscana TaxID=6661 RepID=A0AA88HE16_ARTSF|nr:hypothetical protein QYM36_013839 [Artemia franciscana]